jgi:hypothetical protein
VFKTEVLKSIIDQLDNIRSVNGGDGYKSKMYLLNLEKLFSTDVIKALKNGL